VTDFTQGRLSGRPSPSETAKVAALGMKKRRFHPESVQWQGDGIDPAQHQRQDQPGHYIKSDFSYHAFSRSFWLPDSCKQDQIQARYEDGILHIVLPKKEEVKLKTPTQIQIN
jgi:HSP20 family protein